ncbi:MAG: hypothetical protein RL732_1034 [Bacteroidota bacterium]|jgi:Ser/Thr protein kinase RdoA (MazF antagonist)
MAITENHSAVKAFIPEGNPTTLSVKPVDGGLINHSYKVESPSFHSFLLQQINQHVFRDPEAVQYNYLSIWNYAQSHPEAIKLPKPLLDSDGKALFMDAQGGAWRAFEFMQEVVAHPVASALHEAFATAQTFARFTSGFSGFDPAQLKIVIPDFHNLSFRYKQFQEALKGSGEKRKAEAAYMIHEMLNRSHYKDFYETIVAMKDLFKTRVMHHDAKIANVLFNKQNGEVICAVDFDTVMPGLYFSDLGDMIRSMACNLDENNIEFSSVSIRSDYYDSILSGYYSIMEPFLTEGERKHIHHSGLLMIYMQALRFLSDYLNNDIYYKITYPEQNKDRAMNQLILLQSLESLLRSHYHYSLDTLPSK